MWTVTIKTRKAIPGLAKILLSIILLGTIAFSVYVQNVKQGQFSIDLDTQIKLPTETDVIMLNISSDWRKVSPLLAEGNEVLGVWEMPVEKDSQTLDGYFYTNLITSNGNPNQDLVKIVRANLWMDRLDGNTLRIQENGKNNQGYVSFNIIGIFYASHGPMILNMKMIYLPNGSTLALSMITPQNKQLQSLYWLDEMTKTIKFIPAGPSRQVKRTISDDFPEAVLYTKHYEL
jgi:hypothetical protein